jgi:hypothetical protein
MTLIILKHDKQPRKDTAPYCNATNAFKQCFHANGNANVALLVNA